MKKGKVLFKLWKASNGWSAEFVTLDDGSAYAWDTEGATPLDAATGAVRHAYRHPKTPFLPPPVGGAEIVRCVGRAEKGEASVKAVIEVEFTDE